MRSGGRGEKEPALGLNNACERSPPALSPLPKQQPSSNPALGSHSAAFMGPPPIRAASLSELGGWSLGCGTGAAPTAAQRAPGEGWGQSQSFAGQQRALASAGELLIRVNWHSCWSGWGWGRHAGFPRGVRATQGAEKLKARQQGWERAGNRLGRSMPSLKVQLPLLLPPGAVSLLVSRWWLRRGERLWLMAPLCKGRAVFWEEGRPRESNQQRKRPRKLPPVSSRPGSRRCSPGAPAVLTAP